MTGKERVLRAIQFENPDRIPFMHPIPFFGDFFFMMNYPASDWVPKDGHGPYIHDVLYYLGNWRWKGHSLLERPSEHRKREDEFGCVRETVMADTVGEVTFNPLKSLEDVETFPFPDPHRPERFKTFERLVKLVARDKFIIGDLGVGLWERTHFLRGFAQAMEDLALAPEAIEKLLDRLLDEWHIGLVREYAARGCDGVMMTDDWGMQDRLMISPAMWRKIFKPRYSRLFEETHSQGMKFILHSCGRINDILEDLVEIKLDVLQKDDLEALGTDYLSENFSGRLCFLSPLDVQRTMPGLHGGAIGREIKKLIKKLGNKGGGLMGTAYMQPGAIGLTWEQFTVMQYYYFLHGHRRFKHT